MPIYEYRCAACGHHLEALQKMTEAPLRKCPDCGKSQLRRLVSASRFRLKGSGWYETDFKNQGEKKRNLVGAEASETPAASEPAASPAKEEAAKPAAAEKTDGAGGPAKPVKAKPPVKAKTAAPKPSKSAAKSRAKSART